MASLIFVKVTYVDNRIVITGCNLLVVALCFPGRDVNAKKRKIM